MKKWLWFDTNKIKQKTQAEQCTEALKFCHHGMHPDWWADISGQ